MAGISDALYPSTDAGVVVQNIVVIAVLLFVTVLVRRERSLVTLTWGIGLVLLGLMGTRALH